MQDKMKFVLIILGAIILIMLVLLLQSGQFVNKLRTERDELKESTNSLNAQLSTLNGENKRIKEDFNKAKKSLEDMEGEVSGGAKKVQSLVEERDRLRAGMEALNAKLAASANKSEEASKKETDLSTSPTADAYWAGILKKKAELELRLESLRGDLKAAKLENEQLKREKDKLDMDVQSYETDQKDSSREFEYNKKLADNLTTELTREKTDRFQLSESVKALRKENNFLKSQLKTIYDRKTKLENKFSELQDKNAVLESNMVKLEAFVREKILQVDSLKTDLGIMPSVSGQGASSGQRIEDFAANPKSSIELPPIVIKPGEDDPYAKPTVKPVSIIAVDRDNNFAIVNAGSGAGIKVGDDFRVLRNGEPVGSLSVIKTRDNISACDIKNEFTPIAIGDIVK